MSKPSAIIVLCEDYAQSSFILGFLKRCGLTRGIRLILSPGGINAEQWVRQQYPIQVDAYRRENARKDTRLVVLIDADTGTVRRRIQQLDESLRIAEDRRLREINVTGELIARLIPRRNIETWILALNSTEV